MSVSDVIKGLSLKSLQKESEEVFNLLHRSKEKLNRINDKIIEAEEKKSQELSKIASELSGLEQQRLSNEKRARKITEFLD